MIRLLVVDNTHLRFNLANARLQQEPDIEAVKFTMTVSGALAQLEADYFDLVLLNAHLPDNGALQLTQTITRAYPSTKVMIIDVVETEDMVLPYIQAGAAGYVLQGASLAKLLVTLRAAHEDRALISPRIAAAVMAHLTYWSQRLAHLGAPG